MRSRVLLFVLATLSPVLLSAQASTSPLSEAEIGRMITLGRANKQGDVIKTCAARKPSTSVIGGLAGWPAAIVQGVAGGNNVFLVSLMTARGRVAQDAWDATVKKTSLTASDIPDAHKQPGLWIVVVPRMPDANDDAVLPARVTDLAIVTKLQAGDQTMRPDGALTSESLTWSNVKGATVDYQRTTAWFSGRRLQSLDLGAPAVLVVATEAGARVCEFEAGNLNKLLKAK